MGLGACRWSAVLVSTGETLRSFMDEDQARRYVVAVADPNMAPVAVPSYNSRHYPWDRWQIRALASGVPDDIARLGRSLMRAGYQTQWGDHHPCHCGRSDDGNDMLRLAMADPARALESWRGLVADCGCWREVGETG